MAHNYLQFQGTTSSSGFLGSSVNAVNSHRQTHIHINKNIFNKHLRLGLGVAYFYSQQAEVSSRGSATQWDLVSKKKERKVFWLVPFLFSTNPYFVLQWKLYGSYPQQRASEGSLPSLSAQWLPGMSVRVPLCKCLALFLSLHSLLALKLVLLVQQAIYHRQLSLLSAYTTLNWAHPRCFLLLPLAHPLCTHSNQYTFTRSL